MSSSTRGTYGFASNTKVKLTYNHYDSHPEGLGREIVAFINKINAENGWAKLRIAVDGLTLVEDGAKMSETDAKTYFPKKKSFPKLPTWYEAQHVLQNGKILGEIYAGNVKHLCDGAAFPINSHFCEFCYVIDLNSMTLDVFIGHQKIADPNSPFGQDKNEEGYYPCKFAATWPLDAIPADWEAQVNKLVKDNKK